MKLTEEKELQTITEEFGAALAVFHKRQYAQAEKTLAAVIEQYKDSESFSVQEIHARCQAYRTMCLARLNPVTVMLTGKDDYVAQATYLLNADQPEESLELLEKVEKDGQSDGRTHFLTALVYSRLDDQENLLVHLKKAIAADPHFKVMAFNDPDFEIYHSDPDFLKLVE
jgi:tetratricopeptide (TPR) repeat protein